MLVRKEFLAAWLSSNFSTDSFANSQDVIHSFEVKEPLHLPALKPDCSINLAHHQFENSYYRPYVGSFLPDSDCNSDWGTVILRLNGSVSGRQFDRYGGLWISGVEILRWTSAEPSGSPSTVWFVEKDITSYANLFRTEQTIVLSLDNIVNDLYTGIFNITVSLDIYFGVSGELIADQVVPISQSDHYYGWLELPRKDMPSLPIQNQISKIPNNTIRAELEVFISGHGQDEFWYLNDPNLTDSRFGVYSGGPFKEIEITLNNKLIAFGTPFPTIYTGGINPLLWKPVVALGAYDVPTLKFDLTPFLSLFFEEDQNVLGLNMTYSANSFWLVTANLLVWVDKDEDEQLPFNGILERYSIQSTVPTGFSSGDYDSERHISTIGNSHVSASGILHNSKGWRRTMIERKGSFFSKSVSTNYKNHLDTATTQEFTYNTVTAVEHGISDVKIFTKSKNHSESFPLKVFTSLNQSESKFELFSNVSHSIFRFTEEKLNGKTTKFKRVFNQQISSGTYGTVRKGNATTKQNLHIDSSEGCYKRKVVADGQKIILDHEPKCNILHFQ